MTLAPEWRRDVVLEMWIDRAGSEIRIRLEGKLNRATVSTLVSSVRELVEEGGRDFDFQTFTPHMPDLDVMDILVRMEEFVHDSGGRWCWRANHVGCDEPSKTGVSV